MLLKIILRIAYAAVVIGVSAGSIVYLDAEDLPIVLASLAAKTVTFAVAFVCIMLAGIVYSWRFKINPAETFNVIEKDARGAGIFMGLLIFALAFLGGSVFG